ncbi:hypothetical protein I4F81_006279 [Pyropia yezoensis]|uniref:Uncharacterized protein n=1 Tax=Pyropia yezoensis TaxID=2788 RepID=A0ACC3C0R8_PYRYE|nr:hypothetical protein I4F81_006279 [Neopyropia yezoensis]
MEDVVALLDDTWTTPEYFELLQSLASLTGGQRRIVSELYEAIRLCKKGATVKGLIHDCGAQVALKPTSTPALGRDKDYTEAVLRVLLLNKAVSVTGTLVKVSRGAKGVLTEPVRRQPSDDGTTPYYTFDELASWFSLFLHELDREDVAVLETAADTDGAAAALLRSIELAIANGGTKYPYLAQLVEEDPAKALRLMRVGIRNMRTGLGLGPCDGAAAVAGGGGRLGVGGGGGEGAAPPPSPPPLGPARPGRPDALRQLCSANCAVAEVYLALVEAEGEHEGGGAPAAAAHDAATAAPPGQRPPWAAASGRCEWRQRWGWPTCGCPGGAAKRPRR